LGRTDARVIRGAELVAGVSGHASVALPDSPLVIVILPAASAIPVSWRIAAEIDGRLDASAADLDLGRVCVRNVRCRKVCANTDRSWTSTVTEHWRVLDVDLLVDV
jgi:hypothetical protein